MHKWLLVGPTGADWLIDSLVLEKIVPKQAELLSKVELWPKERVTDSPWHRVSRSADRSRGRRRRARVQIRSMGASHNHAHSQSCPRCRTCRRDASQLLPIH
jgi:hypothetical protein